MQNLVVTIYNTWMLVPAGVRAGVVLLVTAVVSMGMAFAWHFPADWADAREQLAAFWLVVVPVAVGIFQKSIWPPLFAWILQRLGMIQGTTKRQSWLAIK